MDRILIILKKLDPRGSSAPIPGQYTCMHWQPLLTLSSNRSRSPQGHDLYIHCSTSAIGASYQVSLKSVLKIRRRRFLTYLTTRSTEVANAFEWGKTVNMSFKENK